MIPLHIAVQNFRAIGYADIDLTEVTLAAICGRNGAGKSSMFTLAPRFSLFGDVIKGVSMDDLVRRGSTEMSVLFKFEHQGSIYRTIRTRSLKGSGKSTLELQQMIGDRWESRSAEKIKDTEEVIRNLLNLDDETFTASSMILQGRANEFTSSTPAKRKETLQQILGLNIYEQLQAKARDRAAVLNLEIEKAKDKLNEYEEKLKAKPEKEELLHQYNEQKIGVEFAIQTMEAELRQREEGIRQMQTKADKAVELGKSISALLDEVAALDIEKQGYTPKLDRALKILSNEADIIAKSTEYLQVKEQIVVLDARCPEEKRLLAEIETGEFAIAKIQLDQSNLNNRIADVNKLLANRELLAAKVIEYQTAAADLVAIEAIADRWDLSEKQIVDLRAKLGAETTRVQTTEQLLSAEIQTLEGKTGMLEDSKCIDVTIASCRFLEDAQDAKRTLVDKRIARDAIDRTLQKQFTADLDELVTQQQALEYDYAAHRALKTKVEDLRVLADQAGQLQAKEELLASLQDQHQRFTEQIEESTKKQSNMRTQLANVQQELAPLPALRERLTKLEAWAALKDELAAARETKDNIETRIVAIDRDVLLKNSRREEIDLERSALLLDTIHLDTMREKVPIMENELKSYRDQQSMLIGQIGGLNAELAALEQDEQDRQRLAAEMEPKAKQWSRYQTLIRAFGRDGIPALIIENAVPELERIANEILGQMSKGKHYIRFETQRELKSREGVSETLDIMIGDWTAERPYETFSGGEQLRIDYAIRFALAELLARRAGSKVEWLTIDEGLGSQDGEHRGLVLEAIKSVADRFKKVLVITHIEEAQAMFDQLIHIENDSSEVQVKIA